MRPTLLFYGATRFYVQIIHKWYIMAFVEGTMARWQVNAARSHLSEVLDQAETEGPQIITHHGKERCVVLSMNAYRLLNTKETEKPDFITFLLSGPKDDDYVVERDPDVLSQYEVEFE